MSDVRILMPSEREAVLSYAKARLATRTPDSVEQELQSWSARWRAEALDHYLPQGWSFGIFNDNKLEGFILAQPVLFYRGLTQTLWVEHVEANSAEQSALLIDTVHRWARDKHLQCLLVENTGENAALLAEWPRAKVLDDRWIEIRSARF